MLMHQRITRQTLLVIFILLSYNAVQGQTKLYKLEELEVEKQLQLFNKPSVKTIKSKFGDTYNCVDFYKQPAFDHSSLESHNFHPKIKPTLVGSKRKSNTSAINWSLKIWSKDGRCPFGTVPIRKITKDDLIRQRDMPPLEDITFDTGLTTINNKNESKREYISSQEYKLAIVRTLNNPNNRFAGAGMATSLWNPHVEGQQHSACRLKIQKDSDIIQVGWRVDPTLYKDNKTRLFVHFKAGKRQCFNVLCPGFVLVNHELPIDMVFDETSRRGAKGSWEYTMYIDRDLANGNWWLLLEETYEQVGFWPQNIFTSLASFADNVEWGGVAYSPPGVPKPPMGSSYFPIGTTSYDAYCRRLSVLDDKGVTLGVEKTNVYVHDPHLYKVEDYPHMRPGKFQHYVLYGGPGERK